MLLGGLVNPSWPEIVAQYGPAAYAAAWHVLGNVADVEDVVQDVFVEAYALAARSPVSHWAGLLRRLATLRALDRLRRRRRHATLAAVRDRSAGATPDADAIQHELAERLRAALTTLPRREATVFCLRFMEDQSNDQIAEALGIAPGAVAVALHRARAKLATVLDEPHTAEKEKP
jgi:RNA polymerase sigma factor (sigma-70 family)